MAQKKLLCALIALIFVISVAKAQAEDKQEPLTNTAKEADKEWLKGLLTKSQEIVMSNLTEKYQELLAMQKKHGVGEDSDFGSSDLDLSIMVFYHACFTSKRKKNCSDFLINSYTAIRHRRSFGIFGFASCS